MSEVLSVTMPSLLKREVEVVSKTGYYDSSSEFIRDAVRTLLSARKEVRVGIAIELYKEGIVSLGKVAEMSEISYDEARKLLVNSGVKIRPATATLPEMKKELKTLKKRV